MTKTTDLQNQVAVPVLIATAYPYVNVLKLNLGMFFLLSRLKHGLGTELYVF